MEMRTLIELEGCGELSARDEDSIAEDPKRDITSSKSDIGQITRSQSRKSSVRSFGSRFLPKSFINDSVNNNPGKPSARWSKTLNDLKVTDNPSLMHKARHFLVYLNDRTHSSGNVSQQLHAQIAKGL